MKRRVSPIHNDSGSAMLVALLMLPVLTLLCVFAATIGNQNSMVSVHDKSHRFGLYNADASIYGTAKLISQISKVDARPKLEAGASTTAPGLRYSNTASDTAEEFVKTEIIRGESNNPAEDIEFIKIPGSDDGIQSKVTIQKGSSGNMAGGGAEFGTGADGVTGQLNVTIYNIQGDGQTLLPNSTVRVQGEYWFISSKGGQTKGL
jgi:hypothetical protein